MPHPQTVPCRGCAGVCCDAVSVAVMDSALMLVDLISELTALAVERLVSVLVLVGSAGARLVSQCLGECKGAMKDRAVLYLS